MSEKIGIGPLATVGEMIHAARYAQPGEKPLRKAGQALVEALIFRVASRAKLPDGSTALTPKQFVQALCVEFVQLRQRQNVEAARQMAAYQRHSGDLGYGPAASDATAPVSPAEPPNGAAPTEPEATKVSAPPSVEDGARLESSLPDLRSLSPESLQQLWAKAGEHGPEVQQALLEALTGGSGSGAADPHREAKSQLFNDFSEKILGLKASDVSQNPSRQGVVSTEGGHVQENPTRLIAQDLPAGWMNQIAEKYLPELRELLNDPSVTPEQFEARLSNVQGQYKVDVMLETGVFNVSDSLLAKAQARKEALEAQPWDAG